MFSLSPEVLIPLSIAMLISLTLHEWAHAWTAYRLGDNTAYHEGRVTLNPIVHLDVMGSLCFLVSGGIGWAKPVPVNPSNFSNPRRDDILVTAAGPFSNFVLGVICTVIFTVLSSKGLLSSQTPLLKLGSSTLTYLIIANFMLMFFNLIPLFPLDGSHIVKNLLPLNQAYEFDRFNVAYGPYILLGLFLLDWTMRPGILGMLIHPPSEFLIRNISNLVRLVL